MTDPKEPREFSDTSDNLTNNGWYDQDWDSIRPTRYSRDLSEPDDSEDCWHEDGAFGEGEL